MQTNATVLLMFATLAGMALSLENEASDACESDDTGFIQLKNTVIRGMERTPTCAPLSSKGGQAFTMLASVGTPPQSFNAIADSGSNNLVIPSCACNRNGDCNKDTPCMATRDSASFVYTENPNTSSILHQDLMYGSGAIEGDVASDLVRIGSVEAYMKNQLMMMVNEQLNFGGDFEGIVGLGFPETQTGPATKTFVQMAGVTQYSLCFASESSGVVRFGEAPSEILVKNIGVDHWGADFRGMSVGRTDSLAESLHAPTLFCNIDDMNVTAGQETPCGFIPDSGTTLMLGPNAHLEILMGSLCDNWSKCSTAAEMSTSPKSEVLQNVLSSCSSWLNDEHAMDELPSIFLHVVDTNNNPQVLEIPSSEWMIQTEGQRMQEVVKKIGDLTIIEQVPIGEMETVCQPGFGASEMYTQQNGPVWIIGTALFYSHRVGFDTESKIISFSSEPCGTCDAEAEAALLAEGGSQGAGRSRSNVPRKIRKPFREPLYLSKTEQEEQTTTN